MSQIRSIFRFFLKHARPWISKADPKGPTSFGVEFEIDWPDAHFPGSSKISEVTALDVAATPNTNKKNRHAKTKVS